MGTLSNLCSKLSLQEEPNQEDNKVIVTDNDWLEEKDGELAWFHLLGRLYSKRKVNLEGLRVAMFQAWKVEGDMVVKEVGDNLFSFQFEDEVERDRVLVTQPWCFNRALLVLRDFGGLQSPEDISFDSCPYWMRIFDVPVLMMTDRVGKAIGESMGVVLEVDESCGRYLRVRVELPLKEGTTISTPHGELPVRFKYEKLPAFCRVCGILTHLDSDCPLGVIMLKTQGSITKRFTDQLRAEVPDIKPRQSPGMSSSFRLGSGGVGSSRQSQRLNQGVSGSVSSRPRAYRNNVDSMVVRSRLAARAIQTADVSCEIISQFPTGMVARKSGRRRGILLLNNMNEEIGESSTPPSTGKKLKSVVVASNSAGLNHIIPGVGLSASGPNQQLGRVSIISPNREGGGLGLLGQAVGSQCLQPTVHAGPKRAESYISVAESSSTQLSTFVFGATSTTPARRIRRWKKAARVSQRYSFEALGPASNFKVGQKRNSNSSIGGGHEAMFYKRSREGNCALAGQENDDFGDDIYVPHEAVGEHALAGDGRDEGDQQDDNNTQAAEMVPCIGRAGGLALLWLNSCRVSILSFSKSHIDAQVGLDLNNCRRFTGFYGQPETSRRQESWNLLKLSATQYEMPWLCTGDFNELLTNDEKIGGALRPQIQMQRFREAVDACEFQELAVTGPVMTWYWVDRCISPDMAASLDREFTKEDIRIAVFDMAPSKAPGPDGMSHLFYQRFWHIVGDQVCDMALSFLNHGESLLDINDTNVVLIPKVANPVTVKDLRPISLCNVIFKIISKTLTNRLKEILPSIVGQNQSAFVPGRMIFDCSMIAFETVHYMKNKRRGNENHMALKLDLSKAYDRVEWIFLEGIMSRMGFSTRWVHLVMQCVRTVSYSILVNGVQTRRIVPSRGIRQGDPLSPYLFLLCMEGFSSLLQHAERIGDIHGVEVARNAPCISHLFFADDSLLFLRASLGECDAIKNLLRIFELASGQQINIDKSAARYFRNSSFMQAQLGSNPSFVWRSLMAGREVIRVGSQWRIGNGLDVDVWRDRWIGKSSDHMPTPRSGVICSPCPVSALIDNDGHWLIPQLEELFEPEDVYNILCIPLPYRPTPDTLIWSGTTTGQYTVRSGYYAARNMLGKQVISREEISVKWRIVWGSLLLPKIKYFLWRLINNILPTKSQLQLRGLPIGGNCEASNDFWENLLLKAAQLGLLELMAAKLVHDVEALSQRGASMNVNFSHHVWSPPPAGKLKLNTDASFNAEREEAGLGVVFRDETGAVVLSVVTRIDKVMDPMYAEVYAVRFGLILALRYGFTSYPEAEVIALSPKTLMATNRFLCEICGKGFQRDQNLQLHRRGHNLPWKLKQRTTKEIRKRVYVCPEKTCVHHHPSRALGDLTGIKKHFCRKHGEKKWKCDKCSKRYAVQSDWKAHSKTCGTREYKCDCGTLFSRRDSFITHRAFCDALAEETARPISSNDETLDQTRRGLSLWMGQASQGHDAIGKSLQEIHQLGSVNLGSIYSDPLVSTSNPPASDYQLNWVFGNNKVSTSNGEELTSTSLPLSNIVNKESGAHQALVSVPSLFSTQHHTQHQTPSANMSATALLQKAAQIGATSTDTSFLGSFGTKCSNNQVQDGNKYNNGLYSSTTLASELENSANDISTLNQLQMYPAKRRRMQNEDTGGQTRDFLGVGVQAICHPSSINGWI
ncbi:reverse transcriptase [Corchorus capsularis]|uniref:Reverse transcriptase n=1 Tax=Corchorus capsularis TaxID=210143 RepID=A0A1R3J5A5_COCAP|nr:reverse transcriptase [Corchorus capsularis]